MAARHAFLNFLTWLSTAFSLFIFAEKKMMIFWLLHSICFTFHVRSVEKKIITQILKLQSRKYIKQFSSATMENQVDLIKF